MRKKMLRILLADDDKDDCLFFKMALESIPEPFELDVVFDGEKLMKHLLDHAGHLPDVLFLDLNMPRKNGFECLVEIKANKLLAGLTVIIYSTSFEQGVVNLLYENGARYFIRKPGKIDSLKKILHYTVTLILEEINLPVEISDYQCLRKTHPEKFVLSIDKIKEI